MPSGCGGSTGGKPPNPTVHWTAASQSDCRDNVTAPSRPVTYSFGGINRFEKGNCVKMFPDDWRVRLTGAAGAALCMAAALVLGPVAGIDGFVPGGLAIIVALIVGIVLGQLVGRLLFRPSSGRPPDRPPHA
jgi:hypothetical protein